MFLIGDKTLVSLDIIEKEFCCDLDVCRGCCCIEGDAGAPLTSEEEEKIQAEAKRIEEEIQEKTRQVKSLQKFLRTGVSLRSQHLLDEYQETAKRSHLFDGCAVVIDVIGHDHKNVVSIRSLDNSRIIFNAGKISRLGCVYETFG